MTKTKTVSVKLDSKLYTALKTRAELSNSNISDEIRSLLRSALAAEGLDLYGNEVAGFIRGVVDARMDVAALDIERKLDATEDRIAAVLSRPMTAAIMAGLMSADVLKASSTSLTTSCGFSQTMKISCLALALWMVSIVFWMVQ